MLIYDLLAAFVVAMVLSLLLAAAFGWRWPGKYGPLSSLLMLFIVLFFVSWAGGIWVEPFGPAIWDIYWLPFLMVGIIFSLLILALIPFRKPRTVKEAERQAEIRAEARAATETVLSIFFWVLMIALVGVIIARYLNN